MKFNNNYNKYNRGVKVLSWGEIEGRAISFSKRWKNCKGNERQEAQTYEKDFMSVFGIDWHEGLHEYKVRNIEGRDGLIDYLLLGKIIIEMKSKGESLIKAYNQCYDYVKCLKPEEYPELLMVSDFEYIQVTNLKTMQTFNKFKISTLSKHIRMFGCLAGYTDDTLFKTDIEVNIKASYKMAILHDELKNHGYEGRDLEKYLVRLLFCLFAEDTGIFEKGNFENYIKNSKQDGSDLSSRLMTLFSILNTPEEKMMDNIPNELRRFRYINGGLFAENLPPAFFNEKMRDLLLECCDFDWSYISPAIFGAMFQGVMDKEQRREMGAHYTSEENILKLIEPLFLNALKAELEKSKNTKKELEKFHDKLSKLKFLDPACGCGNFLIIIYRELRLIEFEILKMMYGIYGDKQLSMLSLICKVSINQFYGIEYEEFPSQIAQVGLILIKHQMDRQISNYFGMNMIDFPIRQSANIVHGNALEINWQDIIERYDLSYIVGNPPFIGHQYRNKEQISDMNLVFSDNNKGGKLDYVAAWYKKSIDFMKNTNIHAAFVSTNSLTQGETVPILWPYLEKKGLEIDFAYKTFVWNNEAKGNAKVHCVIIGFSYKTSARNIKYIYTNNEIKKVNFINGYLMDAPNIALKMRSHTINRGFPKMTKGSQPTDGKHLLLSEEEYKEFIHKYPLDKKLLKEYKGSSEFINNIKRYCLWLEDDHVNQYRKNKFIMERLKKVCEFRKDSSTESVRKAASQPALFTQNRQPNSDYLVVPAMSSSRRRYIPIGYLSKDIIASNQLYIIPNASLFIFGILTSNIHNAWIKTFCGRLKSDIRYSPSLYNNFPIPNNINDDIKKEIETAALKILEVRELFSDLSLADMYDPLTMPGELLKAHRKLDMEVCKLYGLTWDKEDDFIPYLIKTYNQRTIEALDSKVLATNE